MKRLAKLLLAFIPTRLPIGMSEFDNWSNDIIELSGLPDNDSVRFALASAIMHGKSDGAYVSKFYFVKLMLKGAANQIAHAKFQALKQEQEAKAAEAKRLAEEKALEAQVAILTEQLRNEKN